MKTYFTIKWEHFSLANFFSSLIFIPKAWISSLIPYTKFHLLQSCFYTEENGRVPDLVDIQPSASYWYRLKSSTVSLVNVVDCMKKTSDFDILFKIIRYTLDGYWPNKIQFIAQLKWDVWKMATFRTAIRMSCTFLLI